MPQPFDHHLPLEGLSAGARVLDLGCGPGSTDYPAFRHVRFFGVDQYPDAASAHWPSNAWLTLADAERLPFADMVFDLGLAGFVFEHLATPRAALRELNRVLKPGALLHLSIPRSRSLHDRLYRFTFKGGGHLQRYSLESFAEMVTIGIPQDTAFSFDVLGRYACNTLDEAIDSMNPSLPDQADARPFDYIVIGGGSFGAVAAARLFNLDRTHSHRILVLIHH